MPAERANSKRSFSPALPVKRIEPSASVFEASVVAAATEGAGVAGWLPALAATTDFRLRFVGAAFDGRIR